MKRTTMDSVVKRAGIGVGCICAMTLASCGLLGWLVRLEMIPIEAAPIMAVFVSGICVFATCYVTVRKSAKSRLPLSMAMTAVFTILCFVIKAAIFPKAELSFDWYSAVPFLAAVLAGAAASQKKRTRR